MGLDNRDYLRDESRRYSGGFSGGGTFASESPMCNRLLIVTIIVFVLQMLLTRPWTNEELLGMRLNLIAEFQQNQDAVKVDQLERLPFRPQDYGLAPQQALMEDWFRLEQGKVLSGQVWRLLTCCFLHSRIDLFHIVFNMMFLWFFGRPIESLYGPKEFLCFYLVAALAASVSYLGLNLVTGSMAPMIGASGAILGILALFALHFPKQIIYVMLVIPVEARWVVLGITAFDLFPVINALFGHGNSDGVAHAAHLGGLAFGYAYGSKRWKLYPMVSTIEIWWKAKRRGLKVVRPSIPEKNSPKSQKLTDQMDAILLKISQHGESSLTSAERKTLEKASRELRNRRT